MIDSEDTRCGYVNFEIRLGILQHQQIILLVLLTPC